MTQTGEDILKTKIGQATTAVVNSGMERFGDTSTAALNVMTNKLNIITLNNTWKNNNEDPKARLLSGGVFTTIMFDKLKGTLSWDQTAEHKRLNLNVCDGKFNIGEFITGKVGDKPGLLPFMSTTIKYNGFRITYFDNNKNKDEIRYLWHESITDMTGLYNAIRDFRDMCSKQQQPPQLPSGWSMLTDPDSGRPYYRNNDTGQTSWTPPQ
jgi:hypothetical protein